jgi:general secretion pathway protein D
LLVLLCWSAAAGAAPVSLRFDDLPLPQLVKLLLGEVLSKPYVLDVALPNVLVSIVLPDAQPKTVERELSAILRRVGFALECDKAMCHILTSLVDPREVVVYRPRYRSVVYLSTLIKPWFPSDSFGGVKAPAVLSSPTGLSAQSMVTRDIGNDSLAVTSAAADVVTFRGSADDIGRFNSLIAQLDVVERQLVVNATVFEVQTGSHEGSAWDLVASIANGKLGLEFHPGDIGASGISIKVGDSSAFFAALSSDNRFKVLASPRVRVVSGRSAKFSVGDEVPVLGSVVVDNGGKSTQSVNYRSSGVILDIAAEVFGDVAKLSVSQQISQFSATTTGVASSPTLTKRELKTDIAVRPGEMIVLGGLDQQKDSGAKSGLSFAKWIGAKTSDTASTQVLVFLKVEAVD